MTKPPIIIDTDPGHDDALAIMLLEKSRSVEIKAVTTVAGNSSLVNVTRNARYILDLVESKAPLYSGARKPLQRDLITADVHGPGGLDGASVRKKARITDDAAEKIISLVKEHPRKMTILALGPETNIAAALLKEPRLPNLIQQLVIMGGAIRCPGNKNRVAEFNMFVDPEAADIVFNSGAKITLVPLDVCNDIVLQEKHFEFLKGTPLHQSIMAMMRQFIKGIAKFENIKGALVYDALAAYYLINPQAYTVERADIRVETKGDLTRGMSVADLRAWGKKKMNVNLVTKVDKEKFINDFFRILGQ